MNWHNVYYRTIYLFAQGLLLKLSLGDDCTKNFTDNIYISLSLLQTLLLLRAARFGYMKCGSDENHLQINATGAFDMTAGKRLFVAVAAFFFLAVPWQTSLFCAEPLFPLSEIKAGMRGKTLTVMQGTEIVSLETEIIGVAENRIGPGKHLIIGRLLDEKTKLTGAVHGMSGSPLYIDGKLVGALSRRLMMFEKDAQCGFTPIHDMMDVDRIDKLPPAKKVRPSLFPFSPTRAMSGMLSPQLASRSEPSWLGLPLAFSGVPESCLNALKTIWEGSDFFVLSGGGSAGGRGDKAGGELKPGAAVAAALATGDITMAGTGTLTWREGDRVLAFGHPMMALGEVSMPMCESEIVTTVPSYLTPHKLSNTRREVGTVSQDRLSSIAGRVGAMSSLPKYSISFEIEGEEPDLKEGHFVSHKQVTPSILASLFIAGLWGRNVSGEVATIQVEGEMKIKGHPPLNMDQAVSGSRSSAVMMAIEMAGRVGQLYSQPFEVVVPESLNLRVRVRDGLMKMEVKDVFVEPCHPKPGETVSVTVEVQPYQAQPESRVFKIVLPDQLQRGSVARVEVASAQTFFQKDNGRGALASRFPYLNFSVVGQDNGGVSARGIDEWLAWMNSCRRSDFLVVRLVQDREGLLMGGVRMEGLPPSVQRMMVSGQRDGVGNLSRATLSEETVPAGAEVSGYVEKMLEIE